MWSAGDSSACASRTPARRTPSETCAWPSQRLQVVQKPPQATLRSVQVLEVQCEKGIGSLKLRVPANSAVELRFPRFKALEGLRANGQELQPFQLPGGGYGATLEGLSGEVTVEYVDFYR